VSIHWEASKIESMISSKMLPKKGGKIVLKEKTTERMEDNLHAYVIVKGCNWRATIKKTVQSQKWGDFYAQRMLRLYVYVKKKKKEGTTYELGAASCFLSSSEFRMDKYNVQKTPQACENGTR